MHRCEERGVMEGRGSSGEGGRDGKRNGREETGKAVSPTR